MIGEKDKEKEIWREKLEENKKVIKRLIQFSASANRRTEEELHKKIVEVSHMGKYIYEFNIFVLLIASTQNNNSIHIEKVSTNWKIPITH